MIFSGHPWYKSSQLRKNEGHDDPTNRKCDQISGNALSVILNSTLPTIYTTKIPASSKIHLRRYDHKEGKGNLAQALFDDVAFDSDWINSIIIRGCRLRESKPHSPKADERCNLD